MVDLLIYHNGTSTSVIKAESIKAGLKRFLVAKGKDAAHAITEVYTFNKGNSAEKTQVGIKAVMAMLDEDKGVAE